MSTVVLGTNFSTQTEEGEGYLPAEDGSRPGVVRPPGSALSLSTIISPL
jgi:hypothetical protein